MKIQELIENKELIENILLSILTTLILCFLIKYRK